MYFSRKTLFVVFVLDLALTAAALYYGHKYVAHKAHVRGCQRVFVLEGATYSQSEELCGRFYEDREQLDGFNQQLENYYAQPKTTGTPETK